jgi:hypothetical protein
MYIIDRMINSPILNSKISDEDKQKLRIAALLHDIGHYPLSHVIETVMTEHHTKNESKHEELGGFIVTNSSIGKILQDGRFDPREIAQIITGKSPEPLFNQLMSSELDADRIDYLLRDSIHTGVAYGRFDLNRVIHTLTLDSQGQLCVEESGLHAVESYIVGRYLMWAVVYTHRVTNAFEELIEQIYKECMGSSFPSFEEIQKSITNDESAFVGFNDSTIFKTICEPSDNKYIAKLCEMFTNRTVLEVAMSAQDISQDGHGRREYFLLDEYRKPDKIKALSSTSNVPEEWIFHNSSRTKLPNLKPLIEQVPENAAESRQMEMSKAIRILYRNGKSAPLANDTTSIVFHLRNMSLDQVRIYTRAEYKDELKETLIQELAQNPSPAV